MNYLEVITSAIMGTFLIIFIIVAWLSGALKDATEEGIREMKESWPILLGLLIIAFLPFTIALIFGWT